jgi:hypothetical protein
MVEFGIAGRVYQSDFEVKRLFSASNVAARNKEQGLSSRSQVTN